MGGATAPRVPADLRHHRYRRTYYSAFDCVLQGLALGGEYGGARVYVAEHVPDAKRGFYTSFIQITATLGLFLSLVVVLFVQNSMSREAFSSWGWRIPFIISIFLVGISLYIRLRMKESPIFTQIKSAGMTSAQPLKEAFTKWPNLKRVLISLFGVPRARVVWYTDSLRIVLSANILKVNDGRRTTRRHCVVFGMPCLFSLRPFRSDWSQVDHDDRMFAAALAYFPSTARCSRRLDRRS